MKKITAVICALTFFVSAQANAQSRFTESVKTSVTKDESLNVEAYRKAGFPSLRRIWSPGEYFIAAEAIAALAQKTTETLPRFRSSRSGALFEQMISRDNLLPLDNKKIPIQIRAYAMYQMVMSFQRMLIDYQDALQKGIPVSSEIVELIGFELELLEMGAGWKNVLQPSDDAPGNQYKGKEQNMPPSLGGVTSTSEMIMRMALVKIGASGKLNVSSKLRLIDYMKESFPVLLSAMPKGSALDYQKILKSMIRNEKDKLVNQKLQELQAVLGSQEGRAAQTESSGR